ncbi:hypothetical protein LRP88_14996 [Fusarium phalaenopsidis]
MGGPGRRETRGGGGAGGGGPGPPLPFTDPERQVLDYVRSHMTEFRDPSTKHYLDLMPEEHYEQYAERFSTGDLWMGLFHIVQHAVGPAFRPVWEDSIPERIGADDAIHQPQTEMRHRPPASAITRAICSQLGNIPEVKENPALRGVYASSELGAYIDHAVLAWASDRCRKAVESNESDEGNPWSGEALQAIQAAYQGYERILAGMTSATAISEHDDQQQQQRHLPDERISHVPNEVLRQQQGAVSSSPHLRKGLFRSTRQTGHSVTAGAQWPWKKTYYPNAAAAAAAATAPAIKTSSTAATFVAAVRWIASSPGDGTEKPPATKTEHMQGMPRITVISHLLRSLTLQLKSAVRCRNYQREMLGTAGSTNHQQPGQRYRTGGQALANPR